jgi:hypothetical protein
MNHEDIAVADGLLTPQFLNKVEEELYAEVLLGDEAISFLNSDLGRVLRGYAIQEVEEAKTALLTCPWWNKRKLQRLQFRAAVANQFLGFIQEALIRGRVAESNLKAMRTEQ